MKYYKEKSVIRHDADTRTVALTYQGEIICGKFVDRERKDWLELYNERHHAVLGDRFVPYPSASKDNRD